MTHVQVIQEGKRFYMEARTLQQYQSGQTRYIARNGRALEIEILSKKAPGVNVISRRKK